MIFTYNEVKRKYESDYKISKALKSKKIYKIEKGIYSDKEFVDYIEIINKKYPKAIFARDSAFYMHNLTDVIPRKYELATERNANKIVNKRINQIFVLGSIFEMGKIKMIYEGKEISIYDKERMLVELIRNQKTMPFDYYKEIANNYRKIAEELNMRKIERYISQFKNDYFILKTMQKEIF